jgi:thiamine biosynthesis lipoprotein
MEASKPCPLVARYNQAMHAQGDSSANAVPSRRDFFAGRLQQPDPDGPPGKELSAVPADFLFQATRRAMGCDFQVTFDVHAHPTGPESAMAALDIVEQLEEKLSVYRDLSQVSQLNQSASSQPVAVDPCLFDLLEHCHQLWEQTDGAFDITSTPLSRAWGFYRREGKMPGAGEVENARASVGSEWLKLDRANQTVQFEKAAMEINLGSIGKGFALDRSAAWLAADVEDFIIHGGYSSILARGHRNGKAAEQEGWQIAVRHPLKPQQRLIELTLHDSAMGTSGSANQFFYHAGKRYSHLIDPRSGWPAEGVLSATVICASAADADALATAFFVMGVEQTRQYIDQHEGIQAVLVCPGRRDGSTDLHLVGLSPGSWKLLDDSVNLIDHGAASAAGDSSIG